MGFRGMLGLPLVLGLLTQPGIDGAVARAAAANPSSSHTCRAGRGGPGVTAQSVRCAGEPRLTIRFEDGDRPFPQEAKAPISEILVKAGAEVCALLPALPGDIAVTVTPIDRDLAMVAGVIGSADSAGAVTIRLSTVYPGGVVGAARAGLRRTAFHEFHHLVTGWTLKAIFVDRAFHGGVLPAAVYEGLADVFALDYTGAVADDSLAIPADVEDWLAELVAIPPDTKWKWEDWMNRHPDGRLAIGYRVGAYVVRRAMERSGRSILDLTTLPPDTILALAGVRR